jgi:GxxExxY protein
VAMSILTTEAQRHRENENQKDPRTAPIIGAAIEVHRHLGPGLLESAYEECLCHELHLRGLSFRRQVDLPVAYKGVQLACGYKIDVIVQEEVVLELKTVERLLPVHDAQLLTYLKLSGKHVGLLINFNTALLTRGIKRIVL